MIREPGTVNRPHGGVDVHPEFYVVFAHDAECLAWVGQLLARSHRVFGSPIFCLRLPRTP